MPDLIHFASTGRTSTQNLCMLLLQGEPRATVVHEAIGIKYRPSQAFRNLRQDELVGQLRAVKAHLIRVEESLNSGRSFIDTGWPSFPWIPYLENRFLKNFKFVHIVRNPIDTAISLSAMNTLTGEISSWQRHGLITPFHDNAKHHDLSFEYPNYTHFERALYQWLEINDFLLEMHERECFAGMFKFEDLYGDDPSHMRRLWSACGFANAVIDRNKKTDNYKRLPTENKVIYSRLLNERVSSLADKMGYEIG